MKNVLASVKNKMISRYIVKDETKSNIKSTDINVLLNRVRLDQKKREQKKTIIYSCYINRRYTLRCFDILKYHS